MNLGKNGITLVLGAIIMLMGAEIIFLAYQNRQLKLMLADPSLYLERTLKAGESVPPIRAADINGNEFSLDYGTDAPHTLVLWFSNGCSSCEDNFGFWNAVQKRLIEGRLRVVGFCACTADEGREKAQEIAIEYPVLAVTEPTLVDLYKGNLLPQTVLIDPSGQIVQVWPGALLESKKAEIFATLQSLSTIKPEGGE